MKPSLDPEQLERRELFEALCNETLDLEGMARLKEILRQSSTARREYLEYADFHASLRFRCQTLDDEAFVALEVCNALDEPLHGAEAFEGSLAVQQASSCPEGSPSTQRLSGMRAYALVAAVLLLLCATPAARFFSADTSPIGVDQARSVPPTTQNAGEELDLAPVRLLGSVGAKWAGPETVIPEATLIESGRRLDLVEGIAELEFRCGAHLVVQGPAILRIVDAESVFVDTGRIAARLGDMPGEFVVNAPLARLSISNAEIGADIEVTGGIVTRVYHGKLVMNPTGLAPCRLAAGEGARLVPDSAALESIAEPQELHFVRYLPQVERTISLADIVAGGDGLGEGVARPIAGVSLADGSLVSEYLPPAQAGQFHRVEESPFIDGVFVPNGRRGDVPVDSLGRSFSGFPRTTGDCWGGAIMARRPEAEESLPFIRLEFHGNTYGYVNWLHTAGKLEHLSPDGHGVIGMHSNSGITFDLHSIRTSLPQINIAEFRANLGNLESKPGPYPVEAWVLVDGELRHHRKGFSREDAPSRVRVPLTDQDRFLVLAVTDSDGSTAYDWAAFGDPVLAFTTGAPADRAAATDREFKSVTRTNLSSYNAYPPRRPQARRSQLFANHSNPNQVVAN